MMLTMDPPTPRATMSLIAACMRKNGPRRLTATCSSKSSGVVSSIVPRVVGEPLPHPGSSASDDDVRAVANGGGGHRGTQPPRTSGDENSLALKEGIVELEHRCSWE